MRRQPPCLRRRYLPLPGLPTEQAVELACKINSLQIRATVG